MNARTLRALANEWFERAEEDLGVAQTFFERRDYPYAVTLHAHQSAEKFLKGLLVLHHKDIRDDFKTHSLKKLYSFVIQVEPTLSKDVLVACTLLDPEYIPSRYPEDVPTPKWSDVKKYVAAAVTVRTSVCALLD